MATSAQVQQLYIALLGRAADKPGLDWWLENINGGERTLEQAAAAFTTSEEYVATYGSLQGAELVTAVYSNLFERTPSTEEVAYWVEDGRPADELLAAFLTYASPADRAVINNKVFVAEAYSNATGEDYNLEAAAQIIADVNGTAASVTAALGQLESGSLPGQIPGIGLLNQLVAAQADVVAYETTTAAAVDGYVAQFKAAATGSGAASKALAADATYAQKLTAITTDANDGSTAGLNQLQGVVADTQAALSAAYSALSASDKQKVAEYQAAVTAETAAKAAAPSDVQVAEVQGGLTAAAATGLAALLSAAETAVGATAGTFADVGDLYDYYVDNANVTKRPLIDAEFKDIAYYSSFKAVAAKEAAVNDATAVKTTAEAALNGTYKAALVAADNAEAALKAAQLEKAVADIEAGYDAAGQKVTDINTDISKFNLDNAATAKIADLNGDLTATAAIKDVFYFADKIATTDDHIITGFGAGDNLVIGTAFAQGSALTAGDNNVLEFFLHQGNTGAQLVLETQKYGSDAATVTAGNVVESTTDQVAVITLTGVNVDQLSYENGVISFVA